MDDIIIMGGDLRNIEEVKAQLKSPLPINDLGEVHHFLGIEIKKTSGGY